MSLTDKQEDFWTTRFGEEIKAFAQGDTVVYIDTLEKRQFGESLMRHVYGVYFGGCRFLYFLIEFGRGEAG